MFFFCSYDFIQFIYFLSLWYLAYIILENYWLICFEYIYKLLTIVILSIIISLLYDIDFY